MAIKSPTTVCISFINIYLFLIPSIPHFYIVWMHLVRILNWLSKNWRQKDEGIWEVRGGKQHFVYSKVIQH